MNINYVFLYIDSSTMYSTVATFLVWLWSEAAFRFFFSFNHTKSKSHETTRHTGNLFLLLGLLEGLQKLLTVLRGLLHHVLHGLHSDDGVLHLLVDVFLSLLGDLCRSQREREKRLQWKTSQ